MHMMKDSMQLIMLLKTGSIADYTVTSETLTSLTHLEYTHFDLIITLY